MLSLTVILLAASALPLGSGFRGRPGTDNPYYGRMIGKLQEYAHGIRGIVYAVDESTMFVKGFSYDGTGPDAFFWVGNTARPSPDGFIVAYPEDYVGRDPPILNAYNRTDVILRLPNGKRIRDLKWLSVWCRRFTVNFGDLFIPSGLEIPKARILPEFRRLAHGLRSGNITVLDAKTFYIPNLHYDGAGPDAYFWVGNGTEPTPLGVKVPNEMGSLEPLRGYQGEDIEIQLPGSLTVYDIDWLAVWCVQYRHNFGHVNIPKDLDVPPALGQTKITTSSTASTSTTEASGYSNCREMLDERLQVMWEKQGDNVEIKLAGRIREDQYIAFGISGEPGRAAMVGADVVVAYYDLDRQTFHAVDYYITASSQCDGKNGVCPDERLGGRNDVTMLSGERKSGVTTIKFRRPLQTNEPINDKPILSEGEISIIAAIGPLNSRKEANAHDYRDRTLDDIRIDFSSVNDHSCINSLFNLPEDDSIMAWPVEKIIGETTLSARIGPTGGRRGYTAVTGHPSWGIAWWINDKLIPQVFVERGKTYTFVIEGGDDETNPARYHPFYITDSSEGGYGQKTEHERRQQRLFAGVTFDSEGNPQPTAPGRYCEWAHKTIDMSSESATFAEFFQTLRLMCDEGEPGYLNWTVKEQTPDLVYYQCYTHNNLGWKIHVVDAGWSQSQNGTSSVLSPHRPLALLLPSVLSFLIVSRTLLSR